MNALNSPFTVKNCTFSPRLFLAPMAGISHSAFRRLCADFGGYGALYTEMLSPSALLKEELTTSPFTKRRDSEGLVIYQIKLNGDEDLAPVIERLKTCDAAAIDLNLGCPAPSIRRTGAGKALFDNIEKLKPVLATIRLLWPRLFSVKCRVGDNTDGWEERFTERVRLFENSGVDSLCVHPRFSDEKLKRYARWHLFDWIRTQTKLPLIANGDIKDAAALDLLRHCDGLMIGREAVTKPWIFKTLSDSEPSFDFKEVWLRFFNYTLEDFPKEKAIGRIKEFTIYYAKNFFFGHELFRAVQPSPDLTTLKANALRFFERYTEKDDSGNS